MTGAGGSVTVGCVAERPSGRGLRGFVEAGGYVAIDGEHYDRAVGGWRRIEGIGRTGSGMTPWPVTLPRQTPGGAGAPRLEYEVSLLTVGSGVPGASGVSGASGAALASGVSGGEVTVWAYLSPVTLRCRRAVCATASPSTPVRSRPSTSTSVQMTDC